MRNTSGCAPGPCNSRSASIGAASTDDATACSSRRGEACVIYCASAGPRNRLGHAQPGRCGSDCCPRGDQVPPIGPMVPGLPDISLRCCAHALAHCYTDMLHDRIVSIAIDHTSGAAVAHALRSVELSDVAKRPVPVVAAPELQMPIQIEELPAREAPEPLWLAVQMTLHVLDRRAGVQHRELFPQRFHRLKRGVQLLGVKSTSGDSAQAR